MKRVLALTVLALTVTACGSHTERTVVEKPVVVQPAATVSVVPQPQFVIPDSAAYSVETICPNGYSNITHSCY